MEASAEGSITKCLRDLEQGCDDAGHQLWNHYYHRMVVLARNRLGHATGRIADEEDVAISAFDSFCDGLQTRPLYRDARPQRPVGHADRDHSAKGD